MKLNDSLEDCKDEIKLCENGNMLALLILWRERAMNRPSDLCVQERYAEALILNKKFKEALELLVPLYQKNHDLEFGKSEIICALYGLGKNENDFDWVEKPIVYKLDNNTLEFCFEYLADKKDYSSFLELYSELINRADYLSFNEQELYELLLKHTDLFHFKGDETNFTDLEIKLTSLFYQNKEMQEGFNETIVDYQN